MRRPTELEAAYLAGILDADGCVGASKLRDKRPGRGAGVMFTVFVTMADRQAVDLLVDIYGGHVRQRAGLKAHHRPYFTWQGYGDIGAGLLRDLIPHLRVKREQAITYIEARATFTGGPKKGFSGCCRPSPADLEKRFACLYKIQRLNQRRPI